MFNVSQYVFDVTTREWVQIIEVSEAWGFVSYKLFNPSSGSVYKLPEDKVSAEASVETYLYALDLSIEAAQHIGIENIRSSKLKQLAREKAEVRKRFEESKRICPDFKLVMLVRME